MCLALLLVGAPLAPTTARADWFRVSADDVAAARRHQAQVARAAPRPAARSLILPAAPRSALRSVPRPVRPTAAALPAGTLIAPHEWADYKRAFLAPDGRIVDRENGGISHSEGQGYGMLLAMHAGDREAFERMWRFTRERLQIRKDALLAWRYNPAQTPHVADRNNATDGDVLVAYALLRAAVLWGEPRYAEAADRMVAAIGRELIGTAGGRPFLKPAAFGFDRMPGNDGPVVNLSYYFYAAFALFEVVQPAYPWAELAREGKALTEAARTGARNLVPNWVALARSGRVEMASGFPRRASYDAVRIPLYMAYADLSGFDLSAHDIAWNHRGGGVPRDRDLLSDVAHGELGDPGYRMIAALSACAARGATIPQPLLRYRTTTYFASSLHLLGLVAARQAGACTDRLDPVVIGSRTAGVR
ncbi:glycosyl hydrolase family 8 [Acuticoccus sp. I52.16.1]|uniref:glycosyl hydrolase family 8 n=1 Tax=Acuticoccus sp. I52.16.1 TaxID=2928472 RepID=UPI001FD1E9CC|nr:glycosyl hydrolase family 8 [Acuticoccus sp. I52.16.1]UOM37333.1 glycosyl hydrolase family 8 [Acuticoccus sp. I52.16.1]